jgi:hypothetical protein
MLLVGVLPSAQVIGRRKFIHEAKAWLRWKCGPDYRDPEMSGKARGRLRQIVDCVLELRFHPGSWHTIYYFGDSPI